MRATGACGPLLLTKGTAMRSIHILLATTGLVLTASARADDAPDTIVVTADRTPEPLSRVGQSITVIDAGEIARRQDNTVVDLLRTVPGVSFARNGGIGTQTSVFIRGAESDQTVALIDGIKLNDPSAPGGGFNFGNLLVGNIARVEILRGPSSVLWGSQAIGGVVNLITIPPHDDLHINARGEYGYRNTGQGVANVSDKFGPLSVSVGGGYFRTDGISAFDERKGGKEKDGDRNYGANANFNLALSDAVSVDLRGWYSDTRAGFDGFPPPNFSLGDTTDYGTTRELVGYTGINAVLFDGHLHNRLGFAITDTRRHNYDGTIANAETFAGNGRNERFEYQGVANIITGVDATFGAERERSHFTTSSFGGPVTIGSQTLTSGYGQVVVTPLTGLTATGGARYDSHSRFGGTTTLAGSGVYTPNDGGTTFRASYSEGFKVPSLYQLQSEYGNQLLRPERSRGWDAGVTQRGLDGRIEASATYFSRTSKDLINFVSCNTPLTGICVNRPFGTYDNVARAVSKGVELTLLVRPIDALTLQANYTSLDAENRSPGDVNFGKQLLRRPSQSVNALLDYHWSFGLDTGATLTHVERSFDNAANTRRLQGYVLADLRAAYPLTKQIAVTARIENLFDEKYETTFGYGTTGRAAYGGIRLSY